MNENNKLASMIPDELREKVAFWDVLPDREELVHDTPDETAAAQLYLDDISVDEWPETVRLYGWMRRTLDPELLDVLRFLEDLDAEYGNPDEAWEPTDRVKEAAQSLAKVVAEDFDVWYCDPVGYIDFPVPAEWRERQREADREFNERVRIGESAP